MPLTKKEAMDIAFIINPKFDEVLKQYDFEKYPPKRYQDFKDAFSSLSPLNNQISDSLLWKWGHWGKKNYPQHHKNLINEVSMHWGRFVEATAVANPLDTFEWWNDQLDRTTTYITAAFITHLVHHHKKFPIIDQHNYRAMNFFKSKVRSAHCYKKKPSNWEDIQSLKQFMETLLKELPDRGFGELDKFLMIYGKSLPR